MDNDQYPSHCELRPLTDVGRIKFLGPSEERVNSGTQCSKDNAINSWREQLTSEINDILSRPPSYPLKRSSGTHADKCNKKRKTNNHGPSDFHVELRDIFQPEHKSIPHSTFYVPESTHMSSRQHYHCHWCGFCCFKFEEFYHHLHTNHLLHDLSSENLYQCPKCALLFISKVDLYKHILTTNHIPSNNSVCKFQKRDRTLCNARFVNRFLLLRHKTDVHHAYSKEKLYCKLYEHCPAFYDINQREERDQHQQAHFKVFSCCFQGCSYTRVGPSPLQLLEHLSQHSLKHRMKMCRSCRSIFFVKQQLDNHEKGCISDKQVSFYLSNVIFMSF